jgi:hypothetical protein
VTYPIAAVTHKGVNPPPPSSIGAASTALEVFQLKLHFAYNLGIHACSIVSNCFSDKKDCRSTGKFRVVVCANIQIYNWDGQTVLFAQGLI